MISNSEAELFAGRGGHTGDETRALRRGFQHGVTWALETVCERLRIAESDLSEAPGDYEQIARWIERRSGSW